MSDTCVLNKRITENRNCRVRRIIFGGRPVRGSAQVIRAMGLKTLTAVQQDPRHPRRPSWSSWKEGGNGPHNDVILNRQVWSNVQWRALGIGIYDGFAAMWVGSEADPTLKQSRAPKT
jgi:hypothetical protein